MPTLRADLALLLVTLIWGATFPLIRGAIAHIDSYAFVFMRFSIAMVLFLPLAWRHRSWSKARLLGALGLSFVLWLSYITQTIGMETIASGRAAFITGLNVVMVPFFAPGFGLGRPRKLDVMAAFGAAIGLYCLTDPGRGGVSIGDFWVLGCAVSYALYIVMLQKFLDRHAMNSVWLSFLQVAGVWLWSAPCLVFSSASLELPRSMAFWAALGFCATLATIGTAWLQTHFQRYTTASRTALIFAMEPVFAAMFGYILLGESMPPRGALGAGIILASIVVSEWIKARVPASPPKATLASAQGPIPSRRTPG